MQQLLAGYATFRSKIFPQHSRRFAELTHCQEPEALFITCSDSRVMPEMITQCSPGQLLCCRIAGNLVPPPEETSSGVAATVEYAVRVLRVPNIIVCGHSDCGEMRAVLDEGQLRDLPLLRCWLGYAGPMSHAFRGVMQDPRVWPADERLRVLTELNVIAQLQSLRAHPWVARGLRRGSLQLHGWVYDIASGEICSLDPGTGSFRPLLLQPAEIESSIEEPMIA
jgi:carbonic anhydrase